MSRFYYGVFILILLLYSFSQAQDTLYTEIFENGNLQNVWYPGFNGNNMEVDFMSGNPSGDGWVGKLGNDLSGGNVGESFSGDLTWTDFYVEAQVFIAVSVGTYYGIEFRVDSTGLTSAYQLVARNTNTSLRFRARTEAVTPIPVIREWSSSEIPGGYPTSDGWHKFAVRAVGNQFWFYFDDQELPGNPYSDPTFSSGGIGAYVWDFITSPLYLYIDDIFVTASVSGIDNQTNPDLITGFELHQNYPNPFNPSTTITFDLPKQEVVNLTIFNTVGQKVRNLANASFPAGSHQISWNGENDAGQALPAGVYFYQIRAGEYLASKKMLLVQ